MSTVGNNFNSEAAEIRDEFFMGEASRNYIINLLKDPKEKKIHSKLLMEDGKTLINRVKAIMQKVKDGEYSGEELADVIYMIAHLLAAIEDCQPAQELEKE